MGATFSAGEMVYYRLLFDKSQYSGRVMSDDKLKIILKTDAGATGRVTEGRYVVIAVNGGSSYSQVAHVDHNIVTLERLWEEKREYFRVDDVLPLACSSVNGDAHRKKARVVPVHGLGHKSVLKDAELPEEGVSPLLWKQLRAIDAKLDIVLEKLYLKDEGFLETDDTEVNISGSGMRFVSRELFDAGTAVELKMILPVGDGIVCYGNVVRASERKDGRYDIALQFSDMDDDVREKIIYHVLDRQRRLVSQQVQKNGGQKNGNKG